MKIIVVANSIPGLPVAEYVYHLTHEMGKLPNVEVIVLGNRAGQTPCYSSPNYAVQDCWEFDSYFTPANILSAVCKLKPDIVWFNITLGAFGHSGANLVGLTTPLLLKAAGYKVVTTLHNLADTLDSLNFIVKAGAQLATKLVSLAGPICVMIPEYERLLKDKYHSQVHLLPHGLLGEPTLNGTSIADQQVLLSFGMYGQHKRLEPLLEAMKLIQGKNPNIKLLVAGGDNAHSPGYLARMKEEYPLPNVEFLGYVPEEEVPELFHRSSLVILTNEVLMGESGALVQASMYGKPVITGPLPLFLRKQAEGYQIATCDIVCPCSIAETVVELFTHDPGQLRSWGEQNYAQVTAVSMADVSKSYLQLFERQIEAI